MAPFVVASRRADSRRHSSALRPLLAAVSAAGCIRGLAWVGMPCSSRHTARIVDVARQQARQIFDVSTWQQAPDREELFNAIDEDGNGFLDEREMSRALKDLTDVQVSNLISTIDSNLDGQIDGHEFENWVSTGGQSLFAEAIDERLMNIRRYLDLIPDPAFRETKWKEIERAGSTQYGQWNYPANDLAFKAADWTKFLPKVKEMVIDEDLTAKYRYLDMIVDSAFKARKWKEMRHAASMQWTALDEAKWAAIVQSAMASTDIEQSDSMLSDDDLESEGWKRKVSWVDLVHRAENAQVRV